VHLHGGSIEAFSEGEGKGCTFVYKIPMKKCPQTNDDDLDDEFAMDEKMNEKEEIRPAMLLPSATAAAATMVSDLPRLPIVIPLSPRDGGRSNKTRIMAAQQLSIIRPQLQLQSRPRSRSRSRLQSQQGEGRRASSLLSGEKSSEISAGDLPPTVCFLSYSVPPYIPSSPPL